MIPSSDVKFRISDFSYEVDKHKLQLCYACTIIYNSIKNNSKSLLGQIKIRSSRCSCTGASIKIHIRTKRGNRKVGSLTLNRIKHDVFETHSSLDKKYHNKKMGLWLYCLGIDWCRENKYKIQSSVDYTDEAKRLWSSKTLRKYYKITRVRSGGGWRRYKYVAVPKKSTELAKFKPEDLWPKPRRKQSLLNLMLLAGNQ